MIIYMESLRETLSKNFKRVVEESGMSVRELAKEIGVSETSFHRWKSGSDIPKLEHVDDLARVLGINPGEFYKSDRPVVSISPRGILKKYLVIPDDFVELAFRLEPDSKAWKDLITVLETAIEDQEDKKSKKA